VFSGQDAEGLPTLMTDVDNDFERWDAGNASFDLGTPAGN
jgi:hypothetical protein